MEFKKLFEPITINKLEIKNRTVMPSMGLSYTRDFSLNDRYRAFYRERASGGVGLLTVGPLAIDRVGSAPFMLGLFDDTHIEPLRQFIHELHRETDVKIATQFLHMGRYTFSGLTGMQPMAPSPIPSKLTHETPKEMTGEDIETVKAAYVQAARRAVEVGFDFIEILACTGYLISEFLSPLTNKRSDAYGGPIENRMRFGLEVIREVRKIIGEDLALGIRIAGNDFMEGGHTNKESAQFAAAAEKAGVDAVNVTGGWHETRIPQLTSNVPAGAFVYLSRGIKEAVNVPVFASNRLGDPYVAERALRSGACDMICWGRPLITDPELPNKVREGRFNEIISCISCNQGCFDAIFAGAPVTCILNPRAGNEDALRVEKTDSAKKIMVAGGGPAGMEFALIAAQRGHSVTLYEKEARLGGQVNLAKTPPGKKEFQRLIDSMAARMAHHGVAVHLNTLLTPKMLQKERPDLLVVASGARPVHIDVPGIDKPHVVDAWDVLAEKVWDLGENIVVVGGNATGCETALFVAEMGAPDPETFTFLMYHSAENRDFAAELLHTPNRKVTVIDMIPRFADNVGRTARWSLIKSLRMMGVTMRPNTTLLEIGDDSVLVETKSGEKTIPADTVIMAVGALPVDDLARESEGAGIQAIAIGDAKTPRKITDAVKEGFETALKI
ncbi:MAG: FAD-dependent oxidoreductase [Deltaproteobacteria bacterium]|nr:FAD-dependent oxidoreductase [Deltaproteobacteria bacterium]